MQAEVVLNLERDQYVEDTADHRSHRRADAAHHRPIRFEHRPMSTIGNFPLDNRRPRWCRWRKSRRKGSEDLLLWTNAPSISSSLAPDRLARRSPTASRR